MTKCLPYAYHFMTINGLQTYYCFESKSKQSEGRIQVQSSAVSRVSEKKSNVETLKDQRYKNDR